MPFRPRGLSQVDQALWASYASTIAPLRKRRPAKSVATATPAQSSRPPMTQPASGPAQVIPAPAAKAPGTARAAASPLAVGIAPGGIDRATWHRFQSGKLTALRTLDLHGMTANRAFQALMQFLRLAHADHVRCVEVVTGRGSGETGGVIRRELPHWLNLPEIRPLILGAAHPHKLNQGSVRLILRRIR